MPGWAHERSIVIRWVDSEALTPENVRRTPGRRRRRARAGRLRPSRHRGQGARRALRPRAPGALPGPLPGPAVRRHRVRARRGRRAGAPTRPSSTSSRPHPVIDFMPDQRDMEDKGGTMRLGLYPARLLPGSQGRRGVRRRGHLRAPSPSLRGQQPVPRTRSRRPAWCSPASRPTGAWWRSSSCATIPGSWPPSSTPSSSRGPTGRTRSSTGFVRAAVSVGSQPVREPTSIAPEREGTVEAVASDVPAGSPSA